MNQVFYARIVLIFSVKHTGNQYNSRMYINTSNFNLNEFKSRLLRIEDGRTTNFCGRWKNWLRVMKLKPPNVNWYVLFNKWSSRFVFLQKRHLTLQMLPDTDILQLFDKINSDSLSSQFAYVNRSHSLSLRVEKQRDRRQLFKWAHLHSSDDVHLNVNIVSIPEAAYN